MSFDIYLRANEPLIFERGAPELWVGLRLKNIGNSVASVALPLMGLASGPNAATLLNTFCTSLKRTDANNGYLAFPSQPVDLMPTPVVGVSPQEMERATRDAGGMPLTLVGCIDYRSTLNLKNHYQTGFIHPLAWADYTRGGRIFAFFRPDRRYPEIILLPVSGGDFSE
jgi:hypothetical protein